MYDSERIPFLDGTFNSVAKLKKSPLFLGLIRKLSNNFKPNSYLLFSPRYMQSQYFKSFLYVCFLSSE